MHKNDFSQDFFAALDTHTLGSNLIFERCLPGTSTRLIEAGNSAGIGTVLAAAKQTSGRGRGDHTFESPEDGLYFSVLLPASASGTAARITIAAAVAVIGALDEAGCAAGIKWINDLILSGRKLGGILAERPAAMNGKTVLGIGLNTNSRAEDFSAELRPNIITLSEQGIAVSNGRLCAEILNRLEPLLDQTITSQSRLIQQYKSRCVTIGKELILPNGCKARALDISADGYLMAELEDGTNITINN